MFRCLVLRVTCSTVLPLFPDWPFWSLRSYECQIIYIVKYLVIWIKKRTQEMLTRQGKVPNQHLQSISHKCKSTLRSRIGSLLLHFVWLWGMCPTQPFRLLPRLRIMGGQYFYFWQEFFFPLPFIGLQQKKTLLNHCHWRLITNVMATFKGLTKAGLHLLETDL